MTVCVRAYLTAPSVTTVSMSTKSCSVYIYIYLESATVTPVYNYSLHSSSKNPARLITHHTLTAVSSQLSGSK